MWLHLWVACGPDETIRTPTDLTSDVSPTDQPGDLIVGEATAVAMPNCPLVAEVVVTTAVDATITVTEVGGPHSATSASGTVHTLRFADFAPATEVVFDVVATAADGTSETTSVSWTPRAFVAGQDWPTIEVAVPSTESGLTILPLGTLATPPSNYLVAIDGAGVVRWVYVGTSRFDDVDVTPTGTIAAMNDTGVFELDWACRELARFTWEGSGEDGTVVPGSALFHHEVTVLDDGSWLVLDHELANVSDFPTSYFDLSDRGPAVLDVPVVRRFEPSGATIDEISLLDVLQPDRIGWDALNDGEVDPNSYDWAHANAVQYIAEDDDYVVSVRHQDAVVKFDRTTRAIDVLLADPANWVAPWSDALLEPVGELRWPYHGHAPTWSSDGTVVLFDNRNVDTSPPAAPSSLTVSRAVMYQVDGSTVSEVWSFEDTVLGPLFCSAGSDADVLPNGNGLLTCAFGKNEGAAEHDALGRGNSCVRVIEFDPGTGDTVMDVQMYSADDAVNALGWNSYRGHRIDAIGAVD